MAIALPPTIARFIDASNARDLEAAVDCFGEEAVVEDEGRTHRGIAEVRAWKQATEERFRYTIEPLLLPRAACWRRAIVIPALQPGALPRFGSWVDSTSSPLRARSHEIVEFEFHISPAPSSSRPQTGVGTCGAKFEHSPRLLGLIAQSDWALDGLGDVRNDPFAPTADLIAEKP